MASSLSQRQTVAPEISQQMPRATASRAISRLERRASGRPCSPGSPHASARTSARTSGGKGRRATPARALLEAGDALLVEALAPHGDHLAAGVETRSDLVVCEPLGGQEHHLRAHHIPIRQRIPARPLLQDAPLLVGQLDPVRASSRHRTIPRGDKQDARQARLQPGQNTCAYFRTGPLRSPRGRKAYAGTAPITKASGRSRAVLARVARNKRL